MFGYNKLRGRIFEKYRSVREFYLVNKEELGICYVAVGDRLNGRTGFTQEDIVIWSKILDIKPEEYSLYFFK